MVRRRISLKKLKVILICAILCANLGGCIKPMTRGERLTKELGSEQQMADQMMEDIATALDNGDADALKELFSEAALEEATDIDQQISGVLQFYQGKKQSFEGDASSDTYTKYGEDIEKELTGYYELTTDKEIYKICYIYRVIDKEDSAEEGLSKLEIVKKSLHEQEDFHWQFYTSEPGVYMQE